jgi:hypothetical protein
LCCCANERTARLASVELSVGMLAMIGLSGEERRMDDSGVSAAIAGLQQLIEADGGAFELMGLDPPGVLRLRLVLDNVTCEECILPPDVLAQVTTDFVRRTTPDVIRVELDDPRSGVAP